MGQIPKERCDVFHALEGHDRGNIKQYNAEQRLEELALSRGVDDA